MQAKRSPALRNLEVRHVKGCPNYGQPLRTCPKCELAFRPAVRDAGLGRQRRGTWTKNYAEAKGERVSLEAAVANGTLAAPNATTVKEAATTWLAKAKAGEVLNRSGRKYKPSVTRSYGKSLELHVYPTLGGKRLTDLKRKDVQELVDRLALTLDGQTVKNAITALRVVCRHALARDVITVNPCVGLELPAGGGNRFGGEGQRERMATADEADKLIAALPEQDRPIWETAFFAGLRLGELQGLQVGSVDLEARVIHVRDSWDRDTAQRIDPKYDSSRRTVPIIDRLYDVLKDHIGDRTEGHVFPSTRFPSKPVSASSVGQRADAAWEDAGLERTTLHEARHTFATVMIDANVPIKLVSAFMGHASTAITEEVYWHLLPHSLDDAREAMNAYLSERVSVA